MKDNNPRIFNVLLYGAKGDGIEIQGTASISSTSHALTCTGAAFTANDVGKTIVIDGAGASGAQLATTISAFTDATHVSITAAAGSTVSSVRIVYGTDDTVAIQNAINAAYNYSVGKNSGGKVFIPNGLYIIAGALQTSIGGVNPNCQLYIPAAASSRDNARATIIIEGESIPDFTSNDPINTTPYFPAKTGTVLLSTITGSGTCASVFGTKAPGTAFLNFNYSNTIFKNLSILVNYNTGGAGPSVGGINAQYFATASGDYVKTEIDGSVGLMPQPTNEVAGIIAPKFNCEIVSSWTNCMTIGFKYGFVSGEHTYLNLIAIVGCYNGLVSLTNNLPWYGGLISITWCHNHFFIPAANILDQTAGTCYFSISQFEVESINSTGTWVDVGNTILDSSNFGKGYILRYIALSGSSGEQDSAYSISGGTGIICKRITGPFLPPIDLGSSYYTPGFAYRQGDMVLQSYSAANSTIYNNAQLVSGTEKYINTQAASKIQMLGSGGAAGSIIINNAASGTAGTTPTWNTGWIFKPDGTAGNDATNVVPTAWMDFLASTTAKAALRIRAGAAPTSPNDGDIWNDSTAHIIKSRVNGITLNNGHVSGQTTLISGTKAITITGLTTSSLCLSIVVVTPSGTTSTVQYQGVCTANTLTLQANVAAGTINVADGSTINYSVQP